MEIIQHLIKTNKTAIITGVFKQLKITNPTLANNIIIEMNNKLNTNERNTFNKALSSCSTTSTYTIDRIDID